MRLWWLISALILSGALALLHQWALREFLFWKYDWFDLVMHLLGGLALGALAVGFFIRKLPLRFYGFIVLVLVAWEIFEYIYGAPRESNYALDTLIDLVMGLLGATFAFILARFTLWRSA